MVQERSDKDLVREVLDRVRADGLGVREAAEALGMSPANFIRYRDGGWEVIPAKTRRKLEAFVRKQGQDAVGRRLIREPERHYTEEGEREPGEGETELERILANEQAFVRYLGGARLGGAATPEQRRLQLLDAMNGLRLMITARGDPLPDYFYRVRARIESGEFDVPRRPATAAASVEELDLLEGVEAVDRHTPPAEDTPVPGRRRAAP